MKFYNFFFQNIFSALTIINILKYICVIIHIFSCLTIIISVLIQRGEEGLFQKFSSVQKAVSTGGIYKITIISGLIFMLMPLFFYTLIKR